MLHVVLIQLGRTMLIDSHCHLNRLDLTSYQGKLELALAHAQDKGVGHFLCVCVVLDEVSELLSIAQTHENVQVSVGLHPTEAVAEEPSIEQLVALADHPKVIAVGETGLDYYRCEAEVEWQRQRFRHHIRAAKEIRKPLIVHTRQAQADTVKILQEENAGVVGGVMHCFTETWEMAQAAIDLGFYISFSGIITFQNAKALQDVVKKIPLDRLLIETDAPYLTPAPYRGKPNEPAYVSYVAEAVAHLKDISFEEVAEQTTANFQACFKTRVMRP